MAEDMPLVDLDTSALEVAMLLAERRLPALVFTETDGSPHSILPASQVVRFLVPGYVQDDPSLARVMNESMADRAGEKLANKRVRDLLPHERRELAAVNYDDTVIEVVTFVVAYILIATERVPKMVTALAGAGVIVAVGVASSHDAFYSHETGIDWDVIFLLLGMMIIVGILRQTGVFEYVAIWAAKRAKGSPFRVMVLLVLITAVAP